ncbi:hypothetical protein [Paenibacillus xylanexedens]|uniref:hypothetical protein n=1 Tax=Paenibacillus xylanexedens TaxID=528191 RepID=UPI0011A9EF43|nr:hypothetical protein [Paenibacillus xylanexedens]
MYGIKQVLIENSNEPGDKIVSVELGDLRHLVENIRCEYHELNKAIEKAIYNAPNLNVVELSQTKHRLQNMYTILTGLSIDEIMK